MVEELVNFLPAEPGTMGLIIAIVGSLVGVGIWLLGSRFSRPMITLLTVLLGAFVGMQMPRWFGWQISGAGPAVGAALVLGVTGYVLHGMWVGIGLGTVLASWAALACWMSFRSGASWTWPAMTEGMGLAEFTQAVWNGLPPDVARILPYASATAMMTGLGLAIIWPRVSLILGWSMAGVTLLTGMGVAALDFGRPEWLSRLPSPMWAQGTLVMLMVALGSIIQWKLGPKPAISQPKSRKSKRDDSDDDS